MAINTTIIFHDSNIIASSDIKLHFSGDFVRITDMETGIIKFHKSSDIRTITETDNTDIEKLKTGRQARILISGQHINTTGSIACNGGSFISVRDAGTTTWIPAHMFDEIEIWSSEKSDEETAKFSKMLSAALIKGVDSAAVKRGDSFTITTSNRVIDVASGWLKPEGCFLFIRDYVKDREFWIPSRCVKNIDFRS
ncbi:hypothetical protein [Brucella gallinifaecis]|uniref:hypothetical protein n=1 Tax=Brucella gallinifaecis TaxID=215590 RepID=UPI002361240D|nr:hypothetical protein [Brucella gallinifaecis]